MARFDIDFEMRAEGLTLNGNEVYSEADPIKELVAEANDLGDSVVELCREAKRVLGVDREPLSLWEERANNPRREGYYYSNALRYRRYLVKILNKAALLQGVVENGYGLYRPVREWAKAWYWWATAGLKEVGLITDYEREVDLYVITGQEPCLETHILDVGKRLRHCRKWLKEIKESDDIDDGGYLERSVGEDVDMLSSELQFYRELRLIELETLGRC